MKITIELCYGPYKKNPTKSDMNINIESIERQIRNKKMVKDDVILMDTISILKSIQKQLPE